MVKKTVRPVRPPVAPPAAPAAVAAPAPDLPPVVPVPGQLDIAEVSPSSVPPATRGEHLVVLERLVRRRSRLDLELSRALVAAHAVGLSYAELGRALGVSRQAVRQQLVPAVRDGS